MIFSYVRDSTNEGNIQKIIAKSLKNINSIKTYANSIQSEIWVEKVKIFIQKIHSDLSKDIFQSLSSFIKSQNIKIRLIIKHFDTAHCRLCTRKIILLIFQPFNFITDYADYKFNFERRIMEPICYVPAFYYESLQINSHAFQDRSFENNRCYFVYPLTIIRSPFEILSINESEKVFDHTTPIPENNTPVDKNTDRRKQKQPSIHRQQEYQVDQQFQIQFPSKKKRTYYKKKNTESNLVNQALSFIASQRSQSYLSKLVSGDDQKIKWFYRLMTTIKKTNKKYTNRIYLKRMMEFCEKSWFHRVFLKQKNAAMCLEEVRSVLCKLVFYFLREYSNLSLLTSMKMCKKTLRQHFWRKREVLNFLFGIQDGEQSIEQ